MDHQKILNTTKKYKPRVISLSSNLPLITALANGMDYSKKISNINMHCKSFNYGIVEMMHHNYMNIVAQYLRQKILSTSKIKKTFF